MEMRGGMDVTEQNYVWFRSMGMGEAQAGKITDEVY